MQNIYFFYIFWKKSLMLTKAVYLIAKQQQKTVMLWNIITI